MTSKESNLKATDQPDLPPPLRGAEASSWAHQSIVERLPRIGRRTLAESDFPAPVRADIKSLIAEIPDGPIRPIQDPQAPDQRAWQEYVEPYLGANWLDPPWFFVETYFYRRVIEATGHYRTDPANRIDPFQSQKAQGLASVEALVEAAQIRAELADRLLAALWSNQADLSMWPEGAQAAETPKPAMERLLVDQRRAIAGHLTDLASDSPRVDLVLDNAGHELVADLLLAAALLRADGRLSLVLHLKPHPTYVSDATVEDVDRTLSHLAAGETRSGRSLAESLAKARQRERLRLRPGFFWTSPLPGWRLPASLAAELAESDLVIFKGDYNYRRLLGDLRWDPTFPFPEVVSYLPAPVAALRSLKADLVVGLEPAQIARAAEKDPDWMIDGRWGLIQFAGVPFAHR